MARASRREFLACSVAAAAGVGANLWPAARARSQPAGIPVPPAKGPEAEDDGRYFTWTRAAEGVHVALRMEGGNTMVVAGLAGVGGAALVDTKNAGFGAVLRREAEALAKEGGGGPLMLVVNTHHHFDHVGGNYAFTKDLTVAAHAKAVARLPGDQERLRTTVMNAIKRLGASTDLTVEFVRREAEGLLVDFPKPATFVPTKSLDIAVGESQTLQAGEGGRTLILYYFGPAHTDNDTVVHVPDANVVHTGDLVFCKMHPFLDRGSGGTSEGWIKCLRKVVELCDAQTVVVPGHGELTNRAGVLAQIEYFQRVREAIAKAIKDGRTRDDMKTFEVEPYGEGQYEFQNLRPATFVAIYDELSQAAGQG